MFWRQHRQQPSGEVEPGSLFRAWRWARRVAGALAVVLALGVAGAPTLTNHLLERERERIRAAGEPLTLAEVVPVLPPGEPNAAEVYQRAFDALELTADEKELIDLGPAEELTPEWIEAVRPVVAKNARYFDLLEEAAGIEDCVFPVQWDRGAEVEEPHLGHMREAARMLCARGIVLAMRGRAEEALRCCALIPAMAQHLSDEPTIIGQLVRYALLSVGTRGVERVLSRCDPSPEACRELRGRFGNVRLSESFMHAVHGERAWVRESAFEAMRDATSGATGWASSVIAFQLNNDERLFLQTMRKQIEALELPWPEAKQEAEAAAEEVEGLPPGLYLLGRDPMPRLGRFAEAYRLTASRLDVCDIGLALRAHQAEHGAYPDSLDELVAVGWEVPCDSFTREVYRYRREQGGFIVWGVGPNLNDDGGKRLTQSVGSEDDYDVVFRCER